MATDAQRKANRQNAKKSTGPRTDEGKARSSQNGLKHGLLARDAVMADEDPAEYDRQFQLLEQNIFPKNAIEFALVRQIADAEWRLRRITRIEAGWLTHQLAYTNRDTRKWAPDTILPGRQGENQLLGKSMQDRTQALANLARYQTHMSRNQLRALNMIGKLRAEEARYRRATSHRPRWHKPPAVRSASAPTLTPRSASSAAVHNVGARHAVPARPARRKTSAYRTALTTILHRRHGPPAPQHSRPPVAGVRTNRSARDTNHATRITTDRPVHPRQGRGDKANPISPKLSGINGLECVRSAPPETRNTIHSRGPRPQPCRGASHREVRVTSSAKSQTSSWQT